MIVESLTLKNFRCFKELQMEFDERLTVLVGANGVGKTTVLDGLVIFLEQITLRISNSNAQWVQFAIDSSDLSIESEIDKITCEIKIYNRVLDWNFIPHKIKENIMCLEHDPSGMKDLKPIQDFIIDDGMKNGLPIFVCYSAQRCLTNSLPKYRNNADNNRIFADGFMPEINFEASLNWFDGKDAEEARIRSNTPDKDYRNPELTAVRGAIAKSLGDSGKIYNFPHMEGNPPVFLINQIENGRSYRVDKLGEGYKTMLAVVMDLARRMASANAGRLDDILASPAVVLIDEIELHLHPSWQQTVLPTLMNIFPHTQFIVTTHSPQVLTSIEPKHIRILENNKVWNVNTSTYGAQSWRVLEDVLGVSSRPRDNEAKKDLDAYFALINTGEGTTQAALDLRHKLEEWLYDDPVLTEADMLISRQERAKARKAAPNA